jgi:hypothetical protein
LRRQFTGQAFNETASPGSKGQFRGKPTGGANYGEKQWSGTNPKDNSGSNIAQQAQNIQLIAPFQPLPFALFDSKPQTDTTNSD